MRCAACILISYVAVYPCSLLAVQGEREDVERARRVLPVLLVRPVRTAHLLQQRHHLRAQHAVAE